VLQFFFIDLSEVEVGLFELRPLVFNEILELQVYFYWLS